MTKKLLTLLAAAGLAVSAAVGMTITSVGAQSVPVGQPTATTGGTPANPPQSPVEPPANGGAAGGAGAGPARLPSSGTGPEAGSASELIAMAIAGVALAGVGVTAIRAGRRED